MDYKKIYDAIISKAQTENRKKGNGIYYESHHIVPRCLGGSNEKFNRVLLTAKEHYICHKLLHYMFPSNHKLSLAYHRMTTHMVDKRQLKLTAREYEEVRLAHSVAMTGENHPMFGKNQTPDWIAKRSGENNYFFGKTHTEASKAKRKKTMDEKPQAEIDDENRRRSEALKGENSPNFNKPMHPNVRIAIDLYNSTKTVDQATRDAISKKLTGGKKPQSAIDKQKETIAENGGAWNKGVAVSEKEAERLRLLNLGREHTPDEIAKQKLAWELKPQELKDAQYKKSSDAQKGKSKNPISAARSSATRKRARINALPEEQRIIEEEKLAMIF